MDAALRRLVRQRAGDRCEYCRLPQAASPFARFNIEHIVARQHGGSDDPANLALACARCNGYKGPNLTAIDPQSQQVVPLFNPRTDAWDEHFFTRSAVIVGRTPLGRATAQLLRMNDKDRVKLRKLLLLRREF